MEFSKKPRKPRSPHISVSSVRAKINYLMECFKNDSITNFENIETQLKLAKNLGTTNKEISNWKDRSRIPEDKLKLLANLTNMSVDEWTLPFNSFEKILNKRNEKIEDYLEKNLGISGFDFLSREKDIGRVSEIFSSIQGIWRETVPSSEESIGVPLFIRNYINFRKVNDQGVIECERYCQRYTYSGVCFPVKRYLYIMMDEMILKNEILMYLLTEPKSSPPFMIGVGSGLAMRSMWSGHKILARKCHLTFWGSEQKVAEELKIFGFDRLKEGLREMSLENTAISEIELKKNDKSIDKDIFQEMIGFLTNSNGIILLD